MTTIPTIDNITGNTVMQKFRSLAKLVLDFMTPLYESTEEVIALKPELEQALADVIEQKSAVELALTEVEFGLQQLTTVMETAVIVDKIQTITGQKTFLATTIFTDIETDNLIATIQAEIAGMAIEESGLKTVLSNDNGISFPSPVSMANLDAIVPTTATGSRDTKAANGSRIQNDLDAYSFMVRDTGNQDIYGIKTWHNIQTGTMRCGNINRSLGYHRIYDFGTNPLTHYISMRVSDRYNTAFIRMGISFDFDTLTATLDGSTSIENPSRTAIGVMYDDTNGHFYLIFNRVSGNNVYTNYYVDFVQRGTLYGSDTILQQEDTIIETPTNYSEMMII